MNCQRPIPTVRLPWSLLLALALVACSRQPAPPPTVSPDTLPALLGRARQALTSAPGYRWTTTFTIKTGDTPEGATILVEGERRREPAATRVDIREPGSQSQQAGWIQVEDDLWLYRNGEWVALPASAAHDALARLAFLDPAGLWAALDDSAMSGGERIGEERVGAHDTHHYHLTRRDSAFLPAAQITPTGAISQDIWLDPETALPIKTRLALEGTNPEGVSGQMTLETVLSDIGAPLTIATPTGAAPRAAAGSPRVTETLPDGTALPLAPGAEPALPETVPDNVSRHSSKTSV